MRLFKRRASDPVPAQLVSLAPLNFDDSRNGVQQLRQHPLAHHLPQLGHHQMMLASTGGDRCDDYADYQTVTAFPAQVVEETPKKSTNTSFSSGCGWFFEEFGLLSTERCHKCIDENSYENDQENKYEWVGRLDARMKVMKVRNLV